MRTASLSSQQQVTSHVSHTCFNSSLPLRRWSDRSRWHVQKPFGKDPSPRCTKQRTRSSAVYARHSDEERWLEQLQSGQKIGSEYGEGYIQYRIAGEPQRLDVDTLNEQLRLRGAARMRLLMRPDEAYGMIFDFDGVIADVKRVKRRAWERVAHEEGLQLPTSSGDFIFDKIHDMRLERAVTEVLRWTQDWGRAKDLAWKVAGAYGDEFSAIAAPQSGVTEWLQLLARVNVPCAVVSAFDRLSVRSALDRMGLSEFFMAAVTSEDGMETVSQRFLSAAIKLGRPPDHCVTFVPGSLAGVTAAHNCTMKAVAVQGRHLKQADLSVASLSELAVYNIRRLFANRGSEFMSLKQQQADQPTQKRRIRNGTL